MYKIPIPADVTPDTGERMLDEKGDPAKRPPLHPEIAIQCVGFERAVRDAKDEG